MELVSEVQLNYPCDVTFTEFFMKRTEHYGEIIALVDGDTGRSITYDELRRIVIRCVAALSVLGVKRGDRVCILLANCVEYPIIMMGIMQLGAICVPVNYMFTKYELQDIDCEPSVFITTLERLSDIKYATIARSVDNIKTIIVGLIDKAMTMDGSLSLTTFESLMTSVPADLTLSDLPQLQPSVDNRQLIAMIGYSSGTTGKPKGCMQSHHSLIAAGCNSSSTIYRSHFGGCLDRGDVMPTSPVREVTIAALSMAHMFGVIMFLTHGLVMGVELVVMKRFDVKHYVNLIEKYRATTLYVVPPLLVEVLKTFDTHHLSRAMASVRHVTSGAVYLNESTAQQLKNILPGINIDQQYGMTELMLVLASPAIDESCPPTSAGRPVPGTTIKIVDHQTKRSLGPNKSGELLVKSASLMSGYWQDPSATENSLDEDCWFKTGDAGFYDEAGNVFVVDRIKDILKYKGYQISPAELETVLLRHPDVIDAAVLAVKDEHVGDLPRALVVVRRPDVDTNDIVAFVNERVAAYKRLRAGVFMVERIPRTASGKIIRRLLDDPSSIRVIIGSSQLQQQRASKL